MLTMAPETPHRHRHLRLADPPRLPDGRALLALWEVGDDRCRSPSGRTPL